MAETKAGSATSSQAVPAAGAVGTAQRGGAPGPGGPLSAAGVVDSALQEGPPGPVPLLFAAGAVGTAQQETQEEWWAKHYNYDTYDYDAGMRKVRSGAEELSGAARPEAAS